MKPITLSIYACLAFVFGCVAGSIIEKNSDEAKNRARVVQACERSINELTRIWAHDAVASEIQSAESILIALNPRGRSTIMVGQDFGPLPIVNGRVRLTSGTNSIVIEKQQTQ